MPSPIIARTPKGGESIQWNWKKGTTLLPPVKSSMFESIQWNWKRSSSDMPGTPIVLPWIHSMELKDFLPQSYLCRLTVGESIQWNWKQRPRRVFHKSSSHESIQWNWKCGTDSTSSTTEFGANPLNGIERGELNHRGGPSSEPNPFNGIERQHPHTRRPNTGRERIHSMELKGQAWISWYVGVGCEARIHSMELKGKPARHTNRHRGLGIESIQWNWKKLLSLPPTHLSLTSVRIHSMELKETLEKH